ncbi:hypothetical protein Hanom_Chr02g00134571 [Helianthus anomalus]
MWNSTCLCGSNPGKSSGKTSGYSFTTGMSSIFGSTTSLSTMCAKKATHPFCKHFLAFRQLMILRGVSRFSPWTTIFSPSSMGMRMVFS